MEGKSSVKEDGGASVQVEEEAFFAGTWVLDVCSWNCVFLTPCQRWDIIRFIGRFGFSFILKLE